MENDYIRIFLICGIGEMLFEDLECFSDIILGLVFCCLDYMVKICIFYFEGYFVYGIELVIVGVLKVMKFKNYEIIR